MKSICFNPLWLNHSFRPLNNYATIREINAKLDVIQGALKKEGGALKQKRGEDGLGDEEDTAEVSIQEEEKIKYWKFPVPQERAIYEKLCRGEETLSDQ